MRIFLIALSILALLATTLAGAAHAHPLSDASESSHTAQSLDQGSAEQLNVKDMKDTKGECEKSCNGCHVHCHNHLSNAPYESAFISSPMPRKLPLIEEQTRSSDLIYGLKRPPKA